MSKFGKWYNKIFIGNPDKPDFTRKDLPKTRVDQFFDVVKLHFIDLVVGNLVYTLFLAPLLLWTLYFWFAVTNQAAEETVTLFSESGVEYVMSYLLICVPLYAITGPAKAGLHYCIRNWVWNERAKVGEHFWKEFKRSFWKALAINLINGMLLYAGVWWIELCMLNTESTPALRYVAILLGILLVSYFISSIYHFPQLVTYDLKLKQIFKNSFIYAVAQVPRTFVAVIVYAALAALTVYLYQLLSVIALTVGFAFVFLAQTVLSQFLFDKYVNKPEDRRRGMAPLEDK